MPTNNFLVTWDPTNKKWTAIEDGGASYDLVENSLHETIQYNEIAAPASPSGPNESLAYMDSTSKLVNLSQNAGAFNPIQPLTTKGDLLAYSTLVTRLGVGADGYNLEADSAQATGIKWATATGSPLTTKGDLWSYAATDARLAKGADYRFLVGDTSQSTGLRWFLPPYCELYRSTNFTVNNGAQVNIVWNATVSDAWNMHPGSSATITVPIEGIYHVEVSHYTENITGHWRLRIYPSVGTQGLRQYRGYTGRPSTFFPHATFVVRLPANGTLYLAAYQITGAARTWYGNSTWSRVRVVWIGSYN